MGWVSAKAPSSGRFASTFSPTGRRDWRGRRHLLSPRGEVGLPRIAFRNSVLAIRVRGKLRALLRHLGVDGLLQVGKLVAAGGA